MNNSKSILITGASSGIGAELTKLFARTNHVFACGRNKARLDVLAQDALPNIEPLVFDVTEKTEIAAATKDISALDILVLNAGDCLYIDDPIHFDDKAFERIITTNLISLGYCLNVLLPKVKPGGQVVFVGSSVTYFPFAKAEAYGASKAGVEYLANSLRQSLCSHDISVTLVEPGFVKTPLTDKNDFDMPFLMAPDKAAQLIASGITKRKNRIRFPKRLIVFLRLLALLPTKVSAKMTNKDHK